MPAEPASLGITRLVARRPEFVWTAVQENSNRGSPYLVAEQVEPKVTTVLSRRRRGHKVTVPDSRTHSLDDAATTQMEKHELQNR